MRNRRVIRITLDAFIVALIAAMTFIPYVGYITIPFMQITTIHVAVLLIAVLFGLREGAIAGFSFGLFCLIRAVAMPTAPTDAFFINPLVSVLPRLLLGVLAGGLFDLIRLVKDRTLKITLAFIAMPVLTIIHSVSTLSMLWICYHADPMLASYNYWLLIGGIISLNGAIETGIALILTPLLSFGIYSGIKNMSFLPLKEGIFTMKSETMFKKLTKPCLELAIKDISDLVSIDSSFDSESVSKDNPFGKGVTKALSLVEKIAKRDGFEVKNYDNKVIEIICGDGDKNVTILGHVDVVPACGEWDSNPFELKRTKTHLLARGVADDKGPVMASYYAMKSLRDSGLIKGFQVRLLVGGNEESGSECMKHYFEVLKKPQPTFGFSPDASWPIIFGEKGIFNYVVSKDIKIPHIKSIKGGVATNAVIERCEIVSDDKNLEEFIKKNSKRYTMVVKNNEYHFTIIGKSAHGSTPEIGENAGMEALKAVAEFVKDPQLIELVNKYLPLDGSGLQAHGDSSVMGHNTLNVGKISYDGKTFKIDVNFRYVDTVKLEVMQENIKKNTKFNVAFGEVSPLLYYPIDTPLISTLMKSYQEETGDMKAKPLAIGGGTYAKEASNVVAFGMEHIANEAKMHDANENLKIADLEEAMAVYANAIMKLGALCK